MNRYQLFYILILILSLVSSGLSTTYAIIGSGGCSTQDDIFNDSEWWTDLYGAYETLLNHGFTHDKIIVMYGDGQDFNSGYDRFRNRWQNEIPQITDYSNDSVTIEHVIDSMSQVITASDTFLFWWVIGHGWATTMDDYSFNIQNDRDRWITEADFTTWINRISNYSFRMFIWATCHSGALRDNLANNKTVVLTACEYDQSHHPMYYGQAPFENTVTAVFPNICRWIFNNHTMFGQGYSADDNGDGKQSFSELRSHIQTEYGNVITTGGVPESNTVCISDNGGVAATTYPISNQWSRCLEFKYLGELKARLSQSGYIQLQGYGSSGTFSGLQFTNGSGMSFTTSGLFTRNNDVEYDSLWLNSNLSGSLIFSNTQGTSPIAGVAANGVVHPRGWEAPFSPCLQP